MQFLKEATKALSRTLPVSRFALPLKQPIFTEYDFFRIPFFISDLEI